MMYIYFAITLAGMILQLIGADILVKQSVCFAKITKIPKVYIGVLLCGIVPRTGILIPQLWKWKTGYYDTFSFSMVTSLMELLLILGIAAMICEIKIPRGIIQKDFSYMILVSIVLLYLSADYLFHGKHSIRVISQVDGAILIAFFIYYFFLIGKITFLGIKNSENVKIPSDFRLWCGIGVVILVVSEIILLYFGQKTGNYVLDKCGMKNLRFVVNDILTFLPCFFISIWAVRREQTDIMVGNVLGNIIFYITGEVGIMSLIHPAMVSISEIYEMILMCICSIVVWGFGYSKNKWNRIHGCVMVTIFVTYMIMKLV